MSMDIIFRILITAAVAYLLGSFNFAVIFTKRAAKKDIRDMGSGNAGFTNVLRSVGVGPAVATFIFDFVKGAVAVAFGWWIFSKAVPIGGASVTEYVTYGRYLAGLFAVLGHMFPLYFGFKGGKGVVTTAALMAVIDWRVFLTILSVFLVIFLITKIISLGSIAAAAMMSVSTCIYTYFFDYLPSLTGGEPYRLRYVFISTVCSAFIGGLVILMHKENLIRLFKGEEKVIKVKK